MPRDFNGSTDELVCAVGVSNMLFGTVMAIVKTDSDATSKTILCVRDGGGAVNRLLLQRDAASNLVSARYANAVTPSTIDLTVADGWAFLACSKPTGTSTVRFHKYVYSTKTWTHANGGTNANATATATQLNIGHRNSDQRWDGQIHLIAMRAATLTDDEIERCAYSLPNLWRGQSQGVWLFDQGSTSQKVIDLSGNGANETSSGIGTVSSLSVPTWTYGAPILGATRGGTAAVDATVTLTDGAGLARAAGRVDLPTPQISVTAGAVALGDAPAPDPQISVTAQALATGRAPPAYRTYPKIEGLTDNYNDDSLDATKWTSYANSGATSAETTSQIVVTVDNSAASVYGGINAVERWSLLESSVYFKVSTYPTQSANTQIYLLVRYDTTHRFLFDSINGVWRGRYRDGAGSDTTHASYTGTDPWLKISMASGVVHWWHSADGTSWTEIGTGVTISEAWPGYLTLVDLSFGHFATDIASNTARFDNFNTLGVVNATVTVPQPATARGRVDLPTPGISVTGQALAAGRAELPVPQITVTAGALALGDAPAPVVGTVTVVTAVPAVAIGVVGTGYGSDWGGGWGSLGSVEVIITGAAGAIAVPAVARGSAPVPIVTIAVGFSAATAAGLVGTVTPVLTVTAVATAAGTALPPAPQISVTVGAAIATSAAPLPSVGASKIITAVAATATGAAPFPTPQITVTAVATAAGRGLPPTPQIAVAALAAAAATVTAPTVIASSSRTVTAVAARAAGRAPTPTLAISVTALALAAGTAPAPTVTASTPKTVVAVVAIAAGIVPSPIPGVAVTAVAVSVGRVNPPTPHLFLAAEVALAMAYSPPAMPPFAADPPITDETHALITASVTAAALTGSRTAGLGHHGRAGVTTGRNRTRTLTPTGGTRA